MSEIKPCTEITQADRDAAAQLMPCNTIAECERVADVKAGRASHHLVQAFARHRSDACATVQKERDEAREMLAEAATLIRDWTDWLNCENPEDTRDAADHEAMILQGMTDFLARYEASK